MIYFHWKSKYYSQPLSFLLYQDNAYWRGKGGIYIICHQDQAGIWFHYIGKSKGFSGRFSDHEKWPAACLNGANMVLATVIEDEDIRQDCEEQMIKQYQPYLNIQHIRQGSNGLLSFIENPNAPRNGLLGYQLEGISKPTGIIANGMLAPPRSEY